MHDVQWDDLPIDNRKKVCRQAGIVESMAKLTWREWIPQGKKRLATALEELSGGTATLNMSDWELLEQRRWDTLTGDKRRAEYDKEFGDEK